MSSNAIWGTFLKYIDLISFQEFDIPEDKTFLNQPPIELLQKVRYDWD